MLLSGDFQMTVGIRHAGRAAPSYNSTELGAMVCDRSWITALQPDGLCKHRGVHQNALQTATCVCNQLLKSIDSGDNPLERALCVFNFVPEVSCLCSVNSGAGLCLGQSL